MEGGYHVQNGIVVSDANDAVHNATAFRWPLPQSAVGRQDVLPLTEMFPTEFADFENRRIFDALIRFQQGSFDLLHRFSCRFNEDTDYSDTTATEFQLLSPMRLNVVKLDDLSNERQLGTLWIYDYTPKNDEDEPRNMTQEEVLKKFERIPGIRVAYKDASRAYLLGEHVEPNPAVPLSDVGKERLTYLARVFKFFLQGTHSPGRLRCLFLDYFQLRRFFFTGFRHPEFDDPLALYTGLDDGQRRAGVLKTIQKISSTLEFPVLALQDLASYKFSFRRTLRNEDVERVRTIVGRIRGGSLVDVFQKMTLAQDSVFAYQNVHASLWHLMTGKAPFYETDLGRSNVYVCTKKRDKIVFINVDVREQLEILRTYNPELSELQDPYLQDTLNRVYRALLNFAVPEASLEALEDLTWPDMPVQSALDLLVGLVFARRVESPLGRVQDLHVNLEGEFESVRFGLSNSELQCTVDGTIVDLSLMPFIGFCLYYKKFTAAEYNPIVLGDRLSPILPVAFEPTPRNYPVNVKEFHLRFQYFLQAVLKTYRPPFAELPPAFLGTVPSGARRMYPLTGNVERGPVAIANPTSMTTWYACVFKYMSPFQLHLVSVFDTIETPGSLTLHNLGTTSLLEGSTDGTQTVGAVMRTFMDEEDGEVPVGLPVLPEVIPGAFDAFLNDGLEAVPAGPLGPIVPMAPNVQLPWNVQVAVKGPKAAKAAAIAAAEEELAEEEIPEEEGPEEEEQPVYNVIPAQDFEDEEAPPPVVDNLLRPRRRYQGPLPVAKNLDIRGLF